MEQQELISINVLPVLMVIRIRQQQTRNYVYVILLFVLHVQLAVDVQPVLLVNMLTQQPNNVKPVLELTAFSVILLIQISAQNVIQANLLTQMMTVPLAQEQIVKHVLEISQNAQPVDQAKF